MSSGITIESRIEFKTGSHGRKRMRQAPTETSSTDDASNLEGRTPRVARIMALAIKLNAQVARRELRDYAEISRLGHVTRARVTQIMNLLMLAPQIQEDILFMAPITQGRDRIKEWQLRRVAAIPDWKKQKMAWKELAA